MRVVCLVLDSLGVGALPDALSFGDNATVNTLKSVVETAGGADRFPVLKSIGLIELMYAQPQGSSAALIAKAAEASCAKDTVVGHWELMGIRSDHPFPVFPSGFPAAMVEKVTEICGIAPLGNEVASGTEIIQRLGAKHIATGAPILYTSADSVLQLAAHEEIIPVEKLYEICRRLRAAFYTPAENINRVIARPFIGNAATGFQRTANRKDFTVDTPSGNLLNDLTAKNIPIHAVGKISDIFASISFTSVNKVKDNAEGLEKTLSLLQNGADGFIFVNLVDFDTHYGHRRDRQGYADALQAFDAYLPRLMTALEHDDWLILTADHGCDPTAAGTDHTREYIPVVFWRPDLTQGLGGAYLGHLNSFSDVGATIANLFGVPYHGEGRAIFNPRTYETKRGDIT